MRLFLIDFVFGIMGLSVIVLPFWVYFVHNLLLFHVIFFPDILRFFRVHPRFYYSFLFRICNLSPAIPQVSQTISTPP